MTQEEAKVALVTGARAGIGRFLAEHLLQSGFLVVGCSRNASDLQRANYEHHLADVADEIQVTALLKHISRKYRRLDVLINNAGIASMNAALLTPLASAESVTKTNFWGTFVVLREAAKLMMKQRSGRVVNFTTVAVPLRLEGEAIYAATKSAVETLTRIIAKEVAPYGITVNAIGPSPIATDLTRGIAKSKLTALLEQLPIKDTARFEDVAHAIDFFIHPRSNQITGQVLYLGGAG